MEFYGAENAQELLEDLEATTVVSREIAECYIMFDWAGERADEFAKHGVSRRLCNLADQIELVFESLPVDGVETPSQQARKLAETALQAFVFNTFGLIDNFAHVWVNQMQVLKTDGLAIPDNQVGLRKVNRSVWRSLPEGVKTRVMEYDTWFEYQAEYRHALSHRIPLYIPPYVVFDSGLETYSRLGEEISEALKIKDFELYDRLLGQRAMLEHFRPRMMHSFGEKARPVKIHGQMLCDLMAVNILGQTILDHVVEPNLSPQGQDA